MHAVLYGYLIGWIITSIGLAATTHHRARRASVVILAGAVWPLLILGAAQFAAIALVAEVVRMRESKAIDDELGELLTTWATGDATTHDGRPASMTGGDNGHVSDVRLHRQIVASR